MDAQTAAKMYLDRQNRTSHPAGKFDNGGRWYPSATEECSCCRSIRTPSRNWPYSLMTHCRTIEHVSKLTGISTKDIRREAKKLQAEQSRQPAQVEVHIENRDHYDY